MSIYTPVTHTECAWHPKQLMLDLSLPFLPVTDISAGNSWWKTTYELWAWSKPHWRQRKGLRLPRSWLRVTPVISAQSAVYKQSRRGLGHGLCPEAHPSWRTEEHIWTVLKTSVQRPPGSVEPRVLHVVTSISPGSWVEMPWSGADIQISLPEVSISHAEPREPSSGTNHPPCKLNLLLSAKHHWFGHSNTKNTRVSQRTRGSHKLFVFQERPKELHSQTHSHLKSTKPSVLSTIKQQFAFFLCKRQPAELRNGLTLFHSISPGNTTFLLIYTHTQKK